MSAILAPFRWTADFLSRHKRKIAIGAAVSTAVGGYYLYKRAKPYIDDLKHHIKIMEQEAEAQKQAQLNAGFQNTLQCGETTLNNFAVSVRRELMRVFDLDAIRAKLDKSKKTGTPRTPADLALWDDFKHQGFARTLATVYALARLDVLIKIQLTIVARYVQADTASKNATMKAAIAEQVSKAYFGLAEHAQGQGLRDMCARLLQVVEQAMQKWTMGDLCAYDDLVASIQDIRRTFDASEAQPSIADSKDGDSKLLESLFRTEAEMQAAIAAFTAVDTAEESKQPEGKREQPQSFEQLMAERAKKQTLSPEQATALGKARLAEMVAETRAVLRSPSVQALITQSVDQGFDIILDQLKSAFKGKDVRNTATTPSSSSFTAALPSSQSQTEELVRIPFANAMIKMTKGFLTLLPPPEEPVASPLLLALNHSQAMKDLCAVVYFPTLDYPKPVEMPVMPPGHGGLPGMNPMEAMLMQQMMKGGGPGGLGPVALGAGAGGALNPAEVKQMEQLMAGLAGGAPQAGGRGGPMQMEAMFSAMFQGADGRQMEQMMQALIGPGGNPAELGNLLKALPPGHTG